jgi:hypothetical protein
MFFFYSFLFFFIRYGSQPGVNEGFSTMGSRSLRYSSNFFSQSCDPLKQLGKALSFDFSFYRQSQYYCTTIMLDSFPEDLINDGTSKMLIEIFGFLLFFSIPFFSGMTRFFFLKQAVQKNISFTWFTFEVLYSIFPHPYQSGRIFFSSIVSIIWSEKRRLSSLTV